MARDPPASPGCRFEFQCQYGSIGWSVGAALGYGIGQSLSGKRLIASIGDGSFQVTAQVPPPPSGPSERPRQGRSPAVAAAPPPGRSRLNCQVWLCSLPAHAAAASGQEEGPPLGECRM